MSQNTSFLSYNFTEDGENVFKYRDVNMCSKWKDQYKDFQLCSINIKNNEYGNYIVRGKILGPLIALAKIQNVYVKFWAAGPTPRGQSFTGSGLPFPNEEVAFENTPNRGAVLVRDGSFSFVLDCPNSYYKNMGVTLVPPQVKFRLCDSSNKPISKIYVIKVQDKIPFRTLTWDKKRNWDDGPLFYYNPFLVTNRNQEQILRESAYPCKNKEPANFWGVKPPM